MRQIGHIEQENSARVFSDFLYVQGVENELEPDKDYGWAIWIHSEEELERADRLLKEFLANPDHPRFKAQAATASELRQQHEKERAAYAQKVVDRKNLVPWLYAYGLGPVTLLLIIASAVVFVLSHYHFDTERFSSLLFWPPLIKRGEVWRCITPIFMHGDFLHIIFNMMWLRDLGSMVEARKGSWFFLIFVIIIATASNGGQYLSSGPFFGGMSGVNYGLVGYIWMKGKYDPASGLFLHPSTVTMMVLWFFVCLAGLVGNIANTAHGVGFGLGIAWGYLASIRRK